MRNSLSAQVTDLVEQLRRDHPLNERPAVLPRVSGLDPFERGRRLAKNSSEAFKVALEKGSQDA